MFFIFPEVGASATAAPARGLGAKAAAVWRLMVAARELRSAMVDVNGTVSRCHRIRTCRCASTRAKIFECAWPIAARTLVASSARFLLVLLVFSRLASRSLSPPYEYITRDLPRTPTLRVALGVEAGLKSNRTESKTGFLFSFLFFFQQRTKKNKKKLTKSALHSLLAAAGHAGHIQHRGPGRGRGDLGGVSPDPSHATVSA